ncbi:MAG: hypothetical protein PUJ92_00985 [Bacilli bacterium]|nr:hypothetical protein [Bacilli bacterium]MDY5831932.1 hypothetical protein [Candidatus Onthovivens sp.]
MVVCGVDNLASNKNIKAFGGVLERTKIDPNDNTESNIYWINVDESLENDKYVSKK